MWRPIDRLLNKITMYRLTVYYLIGLLLWAVVTALFGHLPFSPLWLLASTSTAVAVSYLSNLVLAWFWGATTNSESSLISALILALIVPANALGLATIAAAAFLAMASKYFLTVNKTHIFNPVAAGVAGIALLSPEHAATWWVGNPLMLVPVVVGGILLWRKLQRSNVILSFLLFYGVAIGLEALVVGGWGTLGSKLWFALTNSALLFFTFVMLTEPVTLPGKKSAQNWYAALTAILYATPQLRFLPFALTPEMALLAGNIFSHFATAKKRLRLRLKGYRRIGGSTWRFSFSKPSDFHFQAGQYLEWTLPHSPVDNRGNRRYFTIASGPNEPTLDLLVKFYQPGSSFKSALQQLRGGDEIIAGSLMGDFVLPNTGKQKLAFIAGGVGIAPFRSFAQDQITTGAKHEAVLLYSNRRVDDIVDADLFGRVPGWRTIYTLTDRSAVPTDWPGETGPIDAQLIQKTIADYRERTFYISGPQPLVIAIGKQLRQLGVHRRQIITDYFPGYED